MSLIATLGVGILGSLLKGAIGKMVTGKVIDGATDLFKQYLGGEISKEELETRLQETLATSAVEVERANTEMVASTYASFMGMVEKVPLAQKVWAVVTLSMLVIILWHALVVPFLVWKYGGPYPSSGDLVLIANGILVLCIGGGVYALKGGQGSTGGLIERITKAVRR